MKITSGQTLLLLAVAAGLLALATARTPQQPEAAARPPTPHTLRAAARQLTPLVQ